MKGVYVIILFTLSCVNVFLQKVSSETVAVTSTAGTPCLYHLIPGQALQDCVTTIGFLNSTVNEPDELCFMYSEALYCIMRAVDKAGVNCSLSDVERITEPYFHIVPELTFDHCNVTGPPTEVTDICAPKSLSMITFITCRPYLEEMVSFGGGMSCILSKYLLTCINSNLGYFGAKCSETEIQTAVDSPTAAAWLQTHYPAISLKTCFHHEGVKPDPVCTDTLTMFNYQDLPHCPSILSGLNFTGPGALSPKIGCSLINEVLVCMQNSLAKHGGRCTLAQMKASLKSFLHLSAGIFAQENVLDNCQVDETYSTTSICKDNYRLATYLTTTLNQLFDLITGYPSDSAKCSYVVSYSHTTLTSIGVNCSDDDILAALTSSYGQSVMTSLYPSIHLDYCLNYFTSPMTPQQDTPRRVSSETVTVTSPAGAPCLAHLLPRQALQDCGTVLDVLNSTVNEPDELCFMYTEAIYCIKRAVDKAGVNCSLSDVERIAQPYFLIGPELAFDHCNVTGPPTAVTELCAPEPLSNIAFITCRPYLKQMVFFGFKDCVFTKYLLTCISSNLGYFGATCSETEIQTAVDSPTAAAWLQTHYPSVSLKTCFHHESVKPDPICMDTLAMFNYHDLPHCPSILSGLHFTGPSALSAKIGCSLINEVLVCMQKSLARHRGRCTLAQMKASLKSFLHLSAGIFAQENVLDNCQVDEAYGASSICEDDYRLAIYLTTTASKLFDIITEYPSDATKCSYVVSYSHTTLTSIGVNCSDDNILAALSSSYGQSVMTSLYPSIHVDYCLNHLTSPMTPQQDTHRKKRTAVVIKEWLWKYNKVPYGIDESDSV